ncbi:hypothetical protein N657DRAFT_678629 [Parathielavia appendiculata]|uniref:Uncharacterized protein n=1 Tax=Parathielavia appendiculata TaxID=2587402 RepID=A0AAN6U351_9PEZI|nr:hypothetical protein N657DRAFT_678629 [Parathielavia appendiculata]
MLALRALGLLVGARLGSGEGSYCDEDVLHYLNHFDLAAIFYQAVIADLACTYRGRTIINLDGDVADQYHTPGTHIYYGPVILNWIGVSRLTTPGFRKYNYHGPVTINYVGH